MNYETNQRQFDITHGQVDNKIYEARERAINSLMAAVAHGVSEENYNLHLENAMRAANEVKVWRKVLEVL